MKERVIVSLTKDLKPGSRYPICELGVKTYSSKVVAELDFYSNGEQVDNIKILASEYESSVTMHKLSGIIEDTDYKVTYYLFPTGCKERSILIRKRPFEKD